MKFRRVLTAVAVPLTTNLPYVYGFGNSGFVNRNFPCECGTSSVGGRFLSSFYVDVNTIIHTTSVDP